MKSIDQKQNEPESLALLAAQRREYSRAKYVWAVQVFLVVVLPAVFLLINLVAPMPKHVTGLISLTIAVLDSCLLERVKKALRKRAALIQQLFDSRVFDLTWSPLKGSKPDLEDISALANTESIDGLKDWYPGCIRELPIEIGRIVGQRSNCRWDTKLRCYFGRFLLSLATVLIAVCVCIGYGKNLTFQDLIVGVLAPLLPITLWCIREAYAQKDSGDRADRLKKFGDALWDDIIASKLSSESVVAKAYIFQDEVYEHRAASPTVPDWFYKKFKNSFETQMNYSAEQMVKDYLSRRS